ncbi:MAG: glycosyltransferase [Erysipelotrichaceae bacterium]|jgi:glycosyltransferase involved in cell wall biosynthesis|nr:glycosyltransferase [Erysipelotrichaceae bacterium]
MRILYLTTAISESEYDAVATKHQASNPSNQIFHHNIILGLSHHHEILVLSKTTLTKKRYETISKIRYIYPRHAGILTSKRRFFTDEITRSGFKPELIIFDAQNIQLGLLAAVFAKKYHVKKVAIISDHHQYLSQLKFGYSFFFKRNIKHVDAIIGTVPDLIAAYNQAQKPSLALYGVTKETLDVSQKTIGKKYLYYGGTLLPQYGINNLISAFKMLKDEKPDLWLYLSGHAKTESFTFDNDDNIKFLGFISPKMHAHYARNALINLSPRPNTPLLDQYSIPSKVIEYTLYQKPIITTENKYLRIFYHDYLAFTTSEVDALKTTILKVLSLNPQTLKSMTAACYKITKDNFDYLKIGQLITVFLNSLK